MKAVSSLTHPQRVRYLYKTILQLHKALPDPVAELGNEFVRSEFKKHKNSGIEFVGPFMIEWSNYAVELSKQVKEFSSCSEECATKDRQIGRVLDENSMTQFSEAQLHQLLELAQEITSHQSKCESDKGK